MFDVVLIKTDYSYEILKQVNNYKTAQKLQRYYQTFYKEYTVDIWSTVLEVFSW